MKVLSEAALEKLGTGERGKLQPNLQQPVRPVLVVDGNPVHRELLGRLFPRWFLKAVPAASAEDASALLAEARRSGKDFSAILIEKDLPSPGGFCAARRGARLRGVRCARDSGSFPPPGCSRKGDRASCWA